MNVIRGVTSKQSDSDSEKKNATKSLTLWETGEHWASKDESLRCNNLSSERVDQGSNRRKFRRANELHHIS